MFSVHALLFVRFLHIVHILSVESSSDYFHFFPSREYKGIWFIYCTIETSTEFAKLDAFKINSIKSRFEWKKQIKTPTERWKLYTPSHQNTETKLFSSCQYRLYAPPTIECLGHQGIFVTMCHSSIMVTGDLIKFENNSVFVSSHFIWHKMSATIQIKTKQKIKNIAFYSFISFSQKKTMENANDCHSNRFTK